VTPSQIDEVRKVTGAQYMGLTDLEVERSHFKLSECSAEALAEELYCRGWLVAGFRENVRNEA
jgi:hypothetical protein